MASTRPFALVRTKDQWLRAAHARTSFDVADESVALAWTSESEGAKGVTPEGPSAGLAFDSACRLYHSRPREGRVERVLWAATDPFAPARESPLPVDVVETARAEVVGDFVSPPSPEGTLHRPRGLAVDAGDRLFVAEWGGNRILVYDLVGQRLLRSVALAPEGAPGPRPIDVAAHGHEVYAVTESPVQILELSAHGPIRRRELPPGLLSASRVAVSHAGRIAVLDTQAERVWFVEEGFPSIPVSTDATDLEFERDTVVVLAQRPGQDFVRVSLGTEPLDRPGLKARGYDGGGIVRAPDGRIGFWTPFGFRNAAPLRLRYDATGTVTTFRLDSGDWQTVWGRLFLDACVPDETEIRVACVAADEPPEEPTLPRTLPVNGARAAPPFPDLSPPMPPVSLTPRDDDDRSDFQPVHRRESGRELPWAQLPGSDRFFTFEAPVQADAGRYLWVTLKLIGNTRLTPRVRCLRAEHPTHDYLRRLPRTFSRDEPTASFLRRYLAIFEGFLGEADARAFERQALLLPRAAPDEALPWLASFVGLVLDERWAHAPRGRAVVDARRQLIEEATSLFRLRGTVAGLKRFLKIYLDRPVVIIEHFRLRGLGGAVLGAAGPTFTSAILGEGFRVGGAVGSPDSLPLAGTVEDAFRTQAHRFSVIVAAALTGEQLDVVRHVLEVHRPAHTIVDLCTVGAGMRVGLGLHLGLSSIVGPTGGFAPLVLGDSRLGRGTIVGRPEIGTILGSSRLGGDSRVG